LAGQDGVEDVLHGEPFGETTVIVAEPTGG